jgi:hypothetical protein
MGAPDAWVMPAVGVVVLARVVWRRGVRSEK